MMNVCADKLAMVRRMRPASFTAVMFLTRVWQPHVVCVCAQFHIPSVFLKKPRHILSVNTSHHRGDVFEPAWEDLLLDFLNEDNSRSPRSDQSQSLKLRLFIFFKAVIILQF